MILVGPTYQTFLKAKKEKKYQILNELKGLEQNHLDNFGNDFGFYAGLYGAQPHLAFSQGLNYNFGGKLGLQQKIFPYPVPQPIPIPVPVPQPIPVSVPKPVPVGIPHPIPVDRPIPIPIKVHLVDSYANALMQLPSGYGTYGYGYGSSGYGLGSSGYGGSNYGLPFNKYGWPEKSGILSKGSLSSFIK